MLDCEVISQNWPKLIFFPLCRKTIHIIFLIFLQKITTSNHQENLTSEIFDEFGFCVSGDHTPFTCFLLSFTACVFKYMQDQLVVIKMFLDKII